MPDPATKQVNYSFAVQMKEYLQIPFPLAATWTWDSFWRAAYMRANLALERQAQVLLTRGNLQYAEVRDFVEVQRNGLVKEFRRPLTPMGHLYSEILKPSTNLPTLEQLLKKKGSLQAVLTRVGSTRAAVNRMAVVAKVAGPTMIGIEIVMTAVVIELTPSEDRNRTAATQGGGIAGSIGGGIAGGWAGCAALSMLAAPSLVIPIVGEVTTGGACLIGGILGTVGIGALGRWGGHAAGAAMYDAAAQWEWR